MCSPFGVDKRDGPQSHTLFVSNLPGSITSTDVKQIYEPFGQIDSAQLMKDEHGGGRCTAYVTYAPISLELTFNTFI
jgi:RNA recognition motif-containing protein